MRLRAPRPVSVLVADLGLRVEFAAGEELRTEISAKFTRERVAGRPRGRRPASSRAGSPTPSSVLLSVPSVSTGHPSRLPARSQCAGRGA